MTTPAATETGAKRAGSGRRTLGCVALISCGIVAAMAIVILLTGATTRVIRANIRPGMAVQEVITRASGWLTCRVSAGPVDKPLIDLQVRPTSFGTPWVQPQRVFSTPAEMANGLATEMARCRTEWKMTFGYTTMGPKRAYFDVIFSAEGRVTTVSAMRWGRLD